MIPDVAFDFHTDEEKHEFQKLFIRTDYRGIIEERLVQLKPGESILTILPENVDNDMKYLDDVLGGSIRIQFPELNFMFIRDDFDYDSDWYQ